MVKTEKKVKEKFSITRQMLSMYNEIVFKLPYVKGLVEVDVTDGRRIIDDYFEKTGTKLSFTCWIMKCISEAIMENKIVHAYRVKKREIIIPQEVNFGIMIERVTAAGMKVPYMAVIKQSETKTVLEITQEIRKLQKEIIEEKDQLMGNQGIIRKLQFFLFSILPAFISRPIFKKVSTNKKFVTASSGTVGMTSLGMFGKDISGWIIHFPTRTVDFAIGGIKAKPSYINGKVVPRDILNLTIYIDHNIVDGGPAARFTARVVELIQSAFGLNELRS
jgi:pyruvate/2-oxoglutarate dehydrogenase complex dihydrolipoamide acyltransferase (E2) component